MACLPVQGVRARRTIRNAFFRIAGCQALPSLGDLDILSVNGGMVYADWKPEAERWLPMEAEIEYASPEQEELMGPTGQYGLAFLNYGAGRTAYLPWEPARLYHTFGLEDHAHLLRDLVHCMLPSPPMMSTDAPAQVEITLHRQPSTGRIMVQLVNESGHDGVAFHPPIAIGPIHIEFSGVWAAAASARRIGREMAVERSQRGVRVTLEALTDYELIVLEPEDRS